MIQAGIRRLLETNLALRNGERVLVLSDVPTSADWTSFDDARLDDMVRRVHLARTMRDATAAQFPESPVRLACYARRSHSGADLDEETAAALLSADLVLAPTTFSMTHTKARERACAAGARIASMPGIVPETLLPGGPVFVDQDALSADAERLARVLGDGLEATVECPHGTRLTVRFGARKAQSSAGLIRNPGDWGNVPSGEASISPEEDGADGKVVVRPGWFPRLQEEMVLEFAHGRLAAIQGGAGTGDGLRETLLGAGADPRRRIVAEFGVGVNPGASRTDLILEAEKIRGTVHIAVGNSAYLGGTNDVALHVDFVIAEPTVWLDGKLLIQRGTLTDG
jgi:aminopeptidase